ncbi:MAG: YhgE/Pip family protein [Ectobacillus sp.]
MRGFTLLGQEFLAILKNKKILIPLLAVLFVPLLYAGMFLWAFWDPYKQLSDLPVAVVNLDKGAVYDGEELKIGDEFINNLKDNRKFKWEFVSEKKAKEGLENRKYYMMVRIPENFSENATTLLKDDPEKLQLEYIPNESFNFLSAQIGETAVERIKEEIANTLTKTYAENMFASIAEVSEGLQSASNGAAELNKGSEKAKDGSRQVTDGLNTLKEKTGDLSAGVNKLYNGSGELTGKLGELSAGADKLYNGSQQLTNGLSVLANPNGEFRQGVDKLEGGAQNLYNGLQALQTGMNESLAGMSEIESKLPQLTSGAEQLKNGAFQWKEKAGELSGGAKQSAAGAQQITQGLEELNKSIAVLPEPYQTQMKQAVQKLIEDNKQVEQGMTQVASGAVLLSQKAGDISAGAAKIYDGQIALSTGFGQLKAGQEKLASGTGQLTAGSGALADGLGQLNAKANGAFGQLVSGSQQVTNGLAQVADGAGKAQAGSSQITAGLNQAAAGTNQMIGGAAKLADGSGQVTEGLGKITDGSGELASKLGDAAKETGDVKGDDKKYSMFADPVKVKTEKLSEVPNYGTGFTPYFLSLGLFVGALLLSIVFPLRETVGNPKSGLSWFISKFGVLFAVGFIQAIVADFVLLFGLKIEVQNVFYFVVFSILTSITFIALVQFLVTAFSDAGRFIAIIILILQLTTSAGTFPLELIPKALQVFNAWLPMTYSVAGFKAVISSGDFGFMWKNAGILLVYIGLMAAGTIATLSLIHKRYFGRFAEAE